MEINGWKYYNHAAIPTTPPHEDANELPIADKSIWLMENKPLIARWTTDFDCGQETNWWYVIKEAPFLVDSLSTKTRKHIRQAQKKCCVYMISPNDYVDELYKCYISACERYEKQDNFIVKEDFVQQCTNSVLEGIDYWAAFNAETNELIGYMTVRPHKMFAETLTAKYASDFLHLRASDAIHFSVLDYYLNEKGLKYICSGSRNINHKTHVQEYKIETFGFRKVHCRLHIDYNWKIKWIIKILFLFRSVLRKFDFLGVVHRINSILKMEEIAREA